MVYTGEEDKMDEEEVFNNALDLFASLYVVCQRLGLDPKKYF